ncbi:MAG: branched-chain amino acid ABC transporter permease [Rhodospirillales bacterium]|nr:branched-chain amino acid ABC transporter permease [Rhodospirillales bacterium]
MVAELLQFLFSGVTVGATYALVGLGFAIIYNASQVINFAQGEFVMIAGMSTVTLLNAGIPMPVAILIAVAITIAAGLLLEKLAIEPARDASVVTLIIITIGASIFLRGAAELIWGRGFHSMPAFSGSDPIIIGGAAMLPQSLWVAGATIVIIAVMRWFFTRTLLGKAMLATSYNPLVARLMGINTRFILSLSFGMAAMLGGIAGILIAPISLTYPEVGVMLGLKGFCAAILGGLGNPMGAIAGGLIVGISEALTAGYVSSAYKDAVAFVIILVVLVVMPNGLFGIRGTERV